MKFVLINVACALCSIEGKHQFPFEYSLSYTVSLRPVFRFHSPWSITMIGSTFAINDFTRECNETIFRCFHHINCNCYYWVDCGSFPVRLILKLKMLLAISKNIYWTFQIRNILRLQASLVKVVSPLPIAVLAPLERTIFTSYMPNILYKNDWNR